MNGENANQTQSYRVLREPKGGPDVTLIAPALREGDLVRAGNILSVMGYTARLILLTSEGSEQTYIPGGLLQPASVWLGEANKVNTSSGAPAITLPMETDANALARAALGIISR